MNRKLRRIIAFASASVLSAGALVMFAGCTSNSPEVTITYELNGTEYEVEYVLSRSDAPKTVQHFIDLADAGYFDGTCIHDYTSSALYGGGYYYNAQNELTEKDYFEVVRELEEAGNTFTQSVFYTNGDAKTPLYTVYGEFYDNGVQNASSRVNVHSKGALVMYYTDKASSAKGINVTVTRNDGGDNNDGTAEQSIPYATNSATSLFYTYLGTSSTSLDNKYAVFGKTKDFSQLQALLDAVAAAMPEDNEDTEEDESSPTETSESIKLDTLDHQNFGDVTSVFESVRKGGEVVTYNVPKEPILVKSVKVTKY